ncbi:MAG: SDR family NAD(P)-dependent oxidoreductase, partial [Candidatus Aminicenantales bacterium]
MPSLKKTIVFVTGASSGIGRACARAFAREGASVLMAARRADRLKDLAASLASEHGVPVHAFALDVRDPAAVERSLAELP